jgi:hypothetical protein
MWPFSFNQPGLIPFPKGRSAKVEYGIISEAKFLGTISFDGYKHVLVKNNLSLTLNALFTNNHMD